MINERDSLTLVFLNKKYSAGKRLPRTKRRDLIIATPLNDRAHTVFMKTNRTLRGKTRKNIS